MRNCVIALLSQSDWTWVTIFNHLKTAILTEETLQMSVQDYTTSKSILLSLLLLSIQNDLNN